MDKATADYAGAAEMTPEERERGRIRELELQDAWQLGFKAGAEAMREPLRLIKDHPCRGELDAIAMAMIASVALNQEPPKP